MERQILANASPQERLEALRANAYKVLPEYRYTRELERAEIEERQNELSQSMIKIDAEDQKLKEAKEAYNAVVKPLREQIKTTLGEIRTRSEDVEEEVFLLRDEIEERMGIYSRDGRLISERGLLPEERQYSVTEQLRKIN